MRLAALAGFGLLLTVQAGAEEVAVTTGAGRLVVDTANLAVWLEQPDGRLDLAGPVDIGDAAVEVRRFGRALRISVTADAGATLGWPATAEPASVDAWALPLGEGRYVPADDAGWAAWLAARYPDEQLAEQFSLPLWTELRDGFSVTWMLEAPFDTRLAFTDAEGRPSLALRHRFDGRLPYVVRVEIGRPEPVAGALAYRNWLIGNGNLPSLAGKIAALPDVVRLAGAPHIYVWGNGLLKSADVLHWRPFVRAFQEHRGDPSHLAGRLWTAFDAETQASFEGAFAEAAGDAGFVAAWRRDAFIRAINSALPRAVPAAPVAPLPGGHDPAAEVSWMQAARAELVDAFGEILVPPGRWGAGLSLDLVAALRSAGIRRAWLGAPDWRDALWHPEAVAAATSAGYLVGVHDSYISAHPPDEPDSWLTAQMGAEIAATAGYRDETGELLAGFGGRGVYANAAAIAAYAESRMAAVAGAARLNSYFLDGDGTGIMFADHTPGRATTEFEDGAARAQRLTFPAAALGLVSGTEGASALFAGQAHFAHGLLTPAFAWVDPDLRDRASPRFLGGYRPPEASALFTEPVALKPELARYILDPAFRLPLFEMALHDSVVTTHHWTNGSLKFAGEQATTGLLQLLYMTPPLYHLSVAVLERDLPVIAAYGRIWRPLHQRLFNQPMTGFAFLSSDRQLQQTTFEDGTVITVNFDRQERELAGMTLPAQSAHVAPPGEPAAVHEMARIFGDR